jgi:peptide/nickel transport system permease protein
MAVSSETVAQLLGAERNPLVRRLANLGRAVRLIGHRPTGMFGLITIGIAVTMALFGPALAPQNPLSTSSLDFAQRMQGPSSAHWLGTDEWGRDLLSQFLLGARVSLIVGVVAGLASAGIGAVVGIVAGQRLDRSRTHFPWTTGL